MKVYAVSRPTQCITKYGHFVKSPLHHILGALYRTSTLFGKLFTWSYGYIFPSNKTLILLVRSRRIQFIRFCVLGIVWSVQAGVGKLCNFRLVGINCEYASIESSVSLPEAVAMLQSNVFSKQNHTPSDSSLCVDTILRSCLDGDVAEQCKGEIETLAKAVQYYVQHTIAQNETAARCEKEKRLHLENQLKDAFNILDHVRG